MSPPHVCLALTRCRTGSTTIISTIDNDGEMAGYSEILNGTKKFSYQRYLVGRLQREPEARERFCETGPLFALGEYLEHLVEQASRDKPDLRLIVLECKVENLWVMSSMWTNPKRDLTVVAALRELVTGADSVLLLRRTNMLARLCSNRLAHAAGVFHARQGDQERALTAASFSPVSLQPEQVVNEFLAEQEMDHVLDRRVRRLHQKVLAISYEDAYAPDGSDFSEMFRRDFADLTNGIQLPRPIMKRVRQRSDREVISNYDEVVAAIRQTPALAPVAALL